MSTFDFFCVTFSRDLGWTKYLLRSTARWATGFRSMVIAVPRQDEEAFKQLIAPFPFARIVLFDEPAGVHGHVQQMYFKCIADTYTDADYIIHIDSDCVFTEPVSPDRWFTEGRPDVLFRYWKDCPGIPWQGVTEIALNFSCPVETMFSFPFVFPREIYDTLRRHIARVHNKSFRDFVFTAKGSHGAWQPFCEFNTLGNWCLHAHKELFHWYYVLTHWKRTGVTQNWTYWNVNDHIAQLEHVTAGWDLK